MTPEQVALLTDSRLSDEARLIGLLIASRAGEWAPFHRDDFRRLLHGPASKDRVGRAIGELLLHKYVERKDGGQGPDSFRFTVQAAATSAEITVQGAETLAPVTVQAAATLSGASSPVTETPPPPTAGARVDDIHLEKLRRLLGSHAEVLDRFAASAKHAPTWARDIWSVYRPPSGESGDGGGTEWAAMFAGEDEETAVRVLVLALTDYAEKGDRYSGMHFRRYVATAKREVRKVDTAKLEATGSDDAKPWPRREKPPQDAGNYSPGPKPEWKR